MLEMEIHFIHNAGRSPLAWYGFYLAEKQICSQKCLVEFLMFLITTRKDKDFDICIKERSAYNCATEPCTISAAKRCMVENMRLSLKYKWKPGFTQQGLYFLSRWWLLSPPMLTRYRNGFHGGQEGGLSCYHKLPQRHWSIKLWDSYTESREVRVGEARMSLLDWLIGWPRNPGTAEETTAALSLEVKESSVQRGRPKVMNWSFISQISLSGIS